MLAWPARPRTLVALAAVVSHASALWGGFVWLDHAHITDGLAIVPLRHISMAFTQGFAGTGFYRPLMAASLSLDAALGAPAWWFHAISLAWHAAASVMVLITAQALGTKTRSAVVAGLIFAVHPMGALVTGAIAFRSEAMITCALLALLVFHLQRRPWASACALLLGGLTKETALVLGPLFIVALEVERPSKRWKLWLCEAAAFAMAVMSRLLFSPAWHAHFAPLTTNYAVGTRLAALLKSAALAVFPFRHTVCDAFPVTATWSLVSMLGAVVLLGIGWLAWKQRGPAVLLLIALLPSLHLVPIMRWWSPHYVYVPMAFACIVVAEPVVRLWRERSRWGSAVAVAALVMLCLQSLSSGLRYRSDVTLWQPEVAHDPTCREGHFYMGEAARAAGHLDEAVAHYEAAVTSHARVIAYVDQGAALQNLGVVRLSQSRFDDAVAIFRSALAVVNEPSERRQITHNLATAELRLGHAEQAEDLLRQETERNDALKGSLFVRAHALARLGRRHEADVLMARYKTALP